MSVSAAIAEVGEADACLTLLATPVPTSPPQLSANCRAFGHIAIRSRGDDRDNRASVGLPPYASGQVGDALRGSPLVVALMGATRADRVSARCLRQGVVTLIEATPEEYGALVEHMRLRGDLTASFLIRTVAHGKVDFFGSVLVALTGQAESG